MGAAEGHAVVHQVVGEVGGEQHRVAGGGAGAGFIDLHAGDHFGEDGERGLDGVDAIKERLFVLLHVPIVGHRQTFQQGQQRHQIADEAAGLSARQLSHVGVLFLRHQGGAGGVRIAEGDKAKLGTAPQDHVLAQAREMHAAEGDGKEDLGGEVAVAHGIHAVLRDAGEAELLRDILAIQDDGTACERAGAERHDVDAFPGIAEAGGIAGEHLHIGEQMMGKEHGLPALEVGVARHDCAAAALGSLDQGTLEAVNQADDRIHGIAGIEAHIGGDLIVATAGGVELGTRGADALGQLRFDVHVHVFEGFLPLEVAAFDLALEAEQACFDLRLLVGREDAGFHQSLGMGDAAADVLRVEPPVKGHGFAITLYELAGGLGETAFPHDDRNGGENGVPKLAPLFQGATPAA